MKKYILIIILLLFFFTYCGLPSINFYDDLNPPTNLEIVSRSDTQITISFTANNYEENFTGYNIYIVDTESNINIRSKAISHVTFSDGFYESDKTIEDNYIISNYNNGELPTITSEELLEFYNTSEDYGLKYGELENLYEKTDACYVDGELVYEIGEINPLAKKDKVCNYKLRPYNYEFEITEIPDGFIEPTLDYNIVITAYDDESFIESLPSNSVSTIDF